ncbi:hypothetical protein ACR79S_19270 [Sphingobacterium spiritivorum]|uniref:hypothetical protein n=1 Tax=Sphingobacterium spiritivorum TaxID=258 RepID=UPI003DA59428
MNLYLKQLFSKIKCLILIYSFFSFSFNLFGQTDQYKIKPQIASPDVAAFLRYGEYNVGVNTGVPDIKIPLFKVQSGSLSYDVDVDYNASGIKVSQVASSVGLGWSLNSGGVISRSVRALPDEYAQRGYIDLNVSYEEKYSYTTNQQKQVYADLFYDGEPDVFSFRLPTGEGGKFIYDVSKRKFINDFDPGIKIDWINKSSYQSSSFVLTTTNGNRYFFETTQVTFDDSAWEIPLILKSYTQSWFLSRIENIKGESIAYQYETVSAYASLPSGSSVKPEWLVQKSFVKKFLYQADSRDYMMPREVYEENLSYYTQVEPRIKEITMKSGKVIFNYTVPRYDFPGHQLNSIDIYADQQIINKVAFSYDYFVGNNPVTQFDYRLKLNSLSIGVSNDQRYGFRYDMSHPLPATNSTAQDYWGYYNGRISDFLPKIKPLALPGIDTDRYVGESDRSVDTSLIQSGILKEIVYPTGGKTIFTFEPNFYSGQSNTELNKVYGNLKVTGKSKRNPVHDTVDFVVNENVLNNTGYLKIYFSPLKPPGPYYSPPDMQVVRLIDLTTNQNVIIKNRSTNYTQSESHNLQVSLINGRIYRLITTVVDEPSDNLFNASYVEASVSGKYHATANRNIFADGVRIQTIENFDHTGVLVNMDKFNYSEGKVLRELKEVDDNHYFQKLKIDYQCAEMIPCACFYDRNYLVYTGQANILGPNIFGRHIYYESVQKIQYNNKREITGKIGYSKNLSLAVPYSFHSPNSPYQKEFVNNMVFIGNAPSESYYKWDNVSGKFILQRMVERKYDLISNPLRVMKFFRTKIYVNPTCAASQVSIDSDLFGQTPFMLYIPVYRLSRETISEYDANGITISTTNSTESTYDDVFGQLRTNKIQTSDGKVKRNYFIYPYDYIDSTPFLTKLLEKNVIANPIESVTLVENGGSKRILGGKHFTYDNFSRLHSIYELRINSNGIVSNDFKFSNRIKGVIFPEGELTAFLPDEQYEKRLECILYDNFNNLSEVLENGSLSTSYLWGYNGQYPIAEIVNAHYNDVVSAIGGQSVVDALNSGTVTADYIRQKMEILRSNLPGSQVTSYTYKPLVGMTSKTDAKGQTEYYQYDGLQRLQHVLDQFQQLRQSYHYHYRPQ